MTSIFLKPEMHMELFIKSEECLLRLLKEVTDADERLAVEYQIHLISELIKRTNAKKLNQSIGAALGRLPLTEMHAYAEKHGHLHEDDVSRMVH